MKKTRYQMLADQVADQIALGHYPIGSKLPSIRALSQQYHVSITTAQHAYLILEAKGLIQAKQKSGFYVQHTHAPQLVENAQQDWPTAPMKVDQWGYFIDSLTESQQHHSAVRFDRAHPDINAPTLHPLKRALQHYSRHAGREIYEYASPQGHPQLRQQVARHIINAGCQFSPDELLITGGTMEAINLCLRVLTQPGDIVVVESPTFHGILRLLESMGLQVLEIPANTETGIQLDALAFACKKWPVKAVILTPSYSNPLGICLDAQQREALYALLQEHDLPLIEDDVYGDLHYGEVRPKAVKSIDTDGRVLYCSSFSKSIAPGFRVGWLVPGIYFTQVMQQKYVINMATSTLPQLALSKFLEEGHFERHLKRVRHYYKQQYQIMLDAIRRHFPEDTQTSSPNGGFVLWIKLPNNVDALQLSRLAAEERITIMPGHLFGSQERYVNHIRISYALPRTHVVEKALARLGELCTDLSKENRTKAIAAPHNHFRSQQA